MFMVDVQRFNKDVERLKRFVNPILLEEILLMQEKP